MNQKLVITALVFLAVGFVGGSIATRYLKTGGTGAHANEHEDHDDHDNDDEYADHPSEHVDYDDDGGDRGERRIQLTPEVIQEVGIEVVEAVGGELNQTLTLPGEIVLNADHVVHIVPRVSGIVRQVNKQLGDQVAEGEIMAVLESREFAEAKSEDIAAEQRLSLAHANFTRAERLQAKGISSEEDFLTAKQQLAEAQIEHRKTEAHLRALGLTAEEVENVSNDPDVTFSIYELKAPFTGTVIGKHISIGELVDNTSDIFLLADLSNVWVNLTVYQKDLPLIRVGQPVTIFAGEGIGQGTAIVDYVSPVVEEATRTAVARVTLPNPDGRWRPGLFVSGRVQTETFDVPVLVPKTALQTINGETCVFVATEDGFELREVAVGRSDGRNVEITKGLKPDERYVITNAFTLKSELGKAGFEAGHGH